MMSEQAITLLKSGIWNLAICADGEAERRARGF